MTGEWRSSFEYIPIRCTMYCIVSYAAYIERALPANKIMGTSSNIILGCCRILYSIYFPFLFHLFSLKCISTIRTPTFQRQDPWLKSRQYNKKNNSCCSALCLRSIYGEAHQNIGTYRSSLSNRERAHLSSVILYIVCKLLHNFEWFKGSCALGWMRERNRPFPIEPINWPILLSYSVETPIKRFRTFHWLRRESGYWKMLLWCQFTICARI